MGINKIILGSAQFGFKYGINNLGSRINENDVFEILEHAFSEGIRYIDSAEAYGNAHKLIGQFHNKNKSNRFNVITKFKKLNLKSEGDLISHVEKTCESLFVDYIDTYMFHSFSDFKKNLKIYDELKLLRNKGLIKKIGISIYENYQIDDIINNFNNFDIIQLPFNLLDNAKKRKSYLIKAKNVGIEIHARSIFLQGLFFKSENALSHKFNLIKNDLKDLRNLSLEFDLEMADLAIHYVLRKSYIDKILIGVDSLKQLQSNIKSINKDINILFDKIDKIDVKNSSYLNPINWNL
jgi:aryl-alcohol dehydrogenase-like predicted oxidoreductase